MKKLLLLTLLLSPLFAQSAIYKCKIKGVLTFSQFPCGDDAVKIRIKIQNDEPLSQYKEDGKDKESVESYLRNREINNEITKHEKKIKNYQQQITASGKRMQNMNQRTANMLGASTREDAIEEQTKKISSKYQLLIESEQYSIKQLRKEQESL